MIEKSKIEVGWNFTFHKSNYFAWWPRFTKTHLDWKDKFGCPRVDSVPGYYFCIGFWQINLVQGDDNDWEFYFWINKFNDGDLQAAIETWPYKRIEPPVQKPKTML